ncbi:efflux RND transporter periplasmic adaptor subunit [Shewanella sp. NIFS-20-20]|uniref:efflux RND transporter periplasmic adaptor subunit n=1 Tax=Shewanella sp. NIFS-20-20 TaxID=2853806 RepID=UPI001C460AF8|nr:efflux RND transporter periplasmic adaptor subunit [Shewanella sp. NIFS-20-20]MBV7315509.1 efflux RND transporter periplasmic adaptor subunit [Shewanella sp. NIFS-20-20]
MDLYRIVRHATLFACLLGLSACSEEQQQEEKAEYAIPVETVTASHGDISSFYNTTATLEAPQEATVMTRVAGLIASINVEEGMPVKQGQLLASIDAKRQQYELDRTNAEVRIIEQELQRLKKMNNQEYISADSLAKLEYNLQASVARRDLAELQVKESQIRSPIDGVIATRHVKQGNMVREFDPLFHIVSQDELHGIVYLPEQQLSQLQLGQQAMLFASHNPTTEIPADVLRISPVIDSNNGTFKVTLRVRNPEGQLKSGMFTKVAIKFDTRRNSVLVPFNVVIQQDQQQAIYVIKDNKAQRRPVILGYRQGNTVEVLDGLAPGEIVVSRGQHNLKDQALVELLIPSSLVEATAQLPVASQVSQ